MADTTDVKSEPNWKVWIDKTENKLHVEGQLMVNDAALMYELGKSEQGYIKEELLLELTPKLTPGSESLTVNYEENLSSDDAYNKITIMAGAEQVASLPV